LYKSSCFLRLLSAKHFHNQVIIVCPVGKGAFGTHLYLSPITLFVGWLARTGLPVIKGTVAKQTVYIFYSLMAGIIFTFPICKKTG
jgi:hypothetical protein